MVKELVIFLIRKSKGYSLYKHSVHNCNHVAIQHGGRAENKIYHTIIQTNSCKVEQCGNGYNTPSKKKKIQNYL